MRLPSLFPLHHALLLSNFLTAAAALAANAITAVLVDTEKSFGA